jgi:glycosyltransferase involved in cell wall biosynthesis
MRIIHIIFSFKMGGAESMLVDIVNEQIKNNKVILIVINEVIDLNLLKELNPKIIVYKLQRKPRSTYNISFLLRLWYYIIHINPHIIHCHNNNLYPLIFLWKHRSFLTIHNVNNPIQYLNKYKGLFAISIAVAKDIERRTNLKPLINYNGILINQYNRKTSYEINATEEFKIIQVGRLIHMQKGQHLAIKALSYILSETPELNIKLYFIGVGESFEYLTQLADEEKIIENIRFLGLKSKNQIHEELKDYHLLLQPSLFEGFGLTVIEGIAAGIPVIVAELDGPKEILNNLNMGTFCEPNNYIDLAKKIRFIYDLYINKNIMNSNLIAEANVLSEYNVRHTAEQYVSFYKEFSKKHN